jgi:hypothetical protein
MAAGGPPSAAIAQPHADSCVGNRGCRDYETNRTRELIK